MCDLCDQGLITEHFEIDGIKYMTINLGGFIRIPGEYRIAGKGFFSIKADASIDCTGRIDCPMCWGFNEQDWEAFKEGQQYQLMEYQTYWNPDDEFWNIQDA